MQDLELTLDERTLAKIRNRAAELADAAPPLTNAQFVTLRAIFGSGTQGRP